MTMKCVCASPIRFGARGHEIKENNLSVTQKYYEIPTKRREGSTKLKYIKML